MSAREKDRAAAGSGGGATSTSIVLAGVGGQGTILASKLLARAAMARGLHVRTAETIGMAQRGGSVVSHVRIGDGASSPLVGPGRADALIAFEPAEAARQLSYLRSGGTLVTSDAPVVPVSAATGGPAYDLPAVMAYLRASVAPERLVVVDAAAAARAGAIGLTADDLAAAVRDVVAPRFVDLDLAALATRWDHPIAP